MSRFDLSTWRGRLKAYLHFFFIDHAFLRFWWRNAHWLGPDLVRMNQPWPYQLKQWRDRHGIKTVLNLRGVSDSGHYLLEEEACRKLGLKLESIRVSSREAPSREVVMRAKRVFETIEYPVLMHCKSGADRAGIMSLFYEHFRLGLPVREAARQLSWRYGHVKAGMTGVLDYAVERYLEEADASGDTLESWVSRPEYDDQAIKREFRASWWGRLLNDILLRRE